jgi:hypothetical protein
MLGFPGKPSGFLLESLAVRDPAIFRLAKEAGSRTAQFSYEIKDFEKIGFRDDGSEYRP